MGEVSRQETGRRESVIRGQAQTKTTVTHTTSQYQSGGDRLSSGQRVSGENRLSSGQRVSGGNQVTTYSSGNNVTRTTGQTTSYNTGKTTTYNTGSSNLGQGNTTGLVEVSRKVIGQRDSGY